MMLFREMSVEVEKIEMDDLFYLQMKRILPVLLFLGVVLLYTQLWASQSLLVKDIEPGQDGSYPRYMVEKNGILFFTAWDSVHGRELWKSDGTVDGTELVKDITFGPDNTFGTSAQDYSVQNFTVIDDILYFTASTDGGSTWKLWRSDGTEEGTIPLCKTGTQYVNPVKLKGKIYFLGYDSAHGQELWMSDGTAMGTEMVKDIYPGDSNSYPSSITNINNVLFFAADDQEHGRELWKSNGTAAGTTLVQDIWEGGYGSKPHGLTNVNGTLYFVACDGSGIGSELWKIVGTTGSATLVKDIIDGNIYYDDSYSNLMGINDRLYFVVDDGTHGRELWISDGTTGGTRMVKDINSGQEGSIPYLGSMTVMNDHLYFTADDGIHGPELWASDGTLAGTMMVKDTVDGDYGGNPRALIHESGMLFFVASDASHGPYLWRSDGTESGTVRLGYPDRIYISNDASELVSINGVLYFTWWDDGYGTELRKYRVPPASAFGFPWTEFLPAILGRGK